MLVTDGPATATAYVLFLFFFFYCFALVVINEIVVFRTSLAKAVMCV